MREAERFFSQSISRRDLLRISGLVAAGLLTEKIFPGRVLAETDSKSVNSKEVSVEIREPIFWGNRDRPEVALTFDDGYSRPAVESALDTLRERGVRATFFVVGQQLKAYHDLWQQALCDGHEICNHTQTHSYLTTLPSEQIKKELSSWEESAQEVLGKEYLTRMKQSWPYIRFPGGAGHRDNRVLKVVSEAGYQPIAWSAETYNAVLRRYDLETDPVLPIAQEVADHIIDTSQYGSIPLLHFNVWDVTRLGEMIIGIEKKGLWIRTVSQVLREDSEEKETRKLGKGTGQKVIRETRLRRVFLKR